jgi:hypothetical protein
LEAAGLYFALMGNDDQSCGDAQHQRGRESIRLWQTPMLTMEYRNKKWAAMEPEGKISVLQLAKGQHTMHAAAGSWEMINFG